MQKKAADNKYAKLSLALRTQQDGEVENAAGLLLGQDPNDVVVLNALALHHLRKGRAGLAKILLKQGLQLQGANSSMLNNMGLVHQEEGNFALALTSFREAVEADEKNWEGVANLGAAFAHFGDCDKALPHLSQVFEAGFRPASVLHALGVCSAPAAAEGFYKQAIAQDSKNVRLHLNYLIHLVRSKKNMGEAQTQLRRVRSLSVPREMIATLSELEDEMRKAGS